MNNKANRGFTAKDKEINLTHSESADMYRRLVEVVKVGVYMADVEENLFYVNHAFVDILGYSTKDEVVGLNLAKELYADPKDRDVFLKKMSEKGFVKDYEVKNVRKDGSIVILSATSNYIRNDKGEIIGVEGIVHDITENKKLEDALILEKRKLEQILGFDEKIGSIRNFNTLIDFIVEMTSKILEVEKCSLMLLDDDAGELCIQGAQGLRHDIIKNTRIKLGEGIAGYVAANRESILVQNIEYDERFKRANRPSYLSRSFMIAPIRLEKKLIGVLNVADKKSDGKKEAVFNEIDLKVLNSIAREIAIAIENLKLYKELNFLTVTDPLTKLYNYRYFTKSLNYEIKRCKRTNGIMCLIMLDVDDFKSYNDTFGHLEGDALLKSLGEILKSSIRETDIVCRYAGDEFIIILPDTNFEGAQVVAKKIKDKVHSYEFKRKVRISLGVSDFNKNMTQYDLVLRADTALYEDKKNKQ